MTRFSTFLLAITIEQMIIVNSHTWFPDPKRGVVLEARWTRYQAISYKTEAEVEDVCGTLVKPTCSQPFGRPSDEETESCDRSCCHAGYLTGFCQGTVTIGANIINPRGAGETEYRPKINAGSGCECTNNLRDATCGPDGSFAGIRCPFDRSACARKCCRHGSSGGHCGGFLNLHCRCN